MGAMIALLPLTQWIPAVVAVAASLDTIMKDQRLLQRLTATNIAIMKLQNLLNWWASLTLVERRLHDNFEILVLSCEKVANADMVWETVAAKSGVDERRKQAQTGNAAKGKEV